MELSFVLQASHIHLTNIEGTVDKQKIIHTDNDLAPTELHNTQLLCKAATTSATECMLLTKHMYQPQINLESKFRSTIIAMRSRGSKTIEYLPHLIYKPFAPMPFPHNLFSAPNHKQSSSHRKLEPFSGSGMPVQL
jgi:hypothetical protein